MVLHDHPLDGDEVDAVVPDVAAALETRGHQVVLQSLGEDVPELAHQLRLAAPDIVFNLTESFAGKSDLDSSVASLLNLLGLRYTGSSDAGLLLAGDKVLAKKVLVFHEIRTPNFAALVHGALESANELAFPLIVKPPQQDASIGITTHSVVHDLNELLQRVDAVQREYRSPVLVEQYIEGREFYVGVLGNEHAVALPIAELDMSDYPDGVPRVASWAAKWEESHEEYRASRPTFPEDLTPDLISRIQQVALNAFDALRLRDYARVDLRVTSIEEIFVIEVNPNCYLRRGETFAEAARRAGIEYEDLVNRVLELASARYAR
jgi:D-alanine-D-alanine ligase